MEPTQGLYARLESEWLRTGTSPSARHSVRQWGRTDPLLSVWPDADAVVRAIQTRGDPTRSNRLLAAVLRAAADDDFATRTALQALVPGLAATSRRYGWRVGAIGPWLVRDELDQDIVGFAFEELRSIIDAPVAWPATRVMDRVGGRLRTLVNAHDRDVAGRVAVAEIPDNACVESATDLLARELRDAVRVGALNRTSAAVVFATDVMGYAPAEVAAALGRTRWWAYKTRQRAAQRLCTS